MHTGYVQRAIQLKAAVSEAERINRPLILWPEDVGHITPNDLPLIDLKVAEREFIVIEREWRYTDEPLCLPTPGKAYAVVEEIEKTSGTLMEVVTFRPKTADECKCDEDRERELWLLAKAQDELIVRMGRLIEAIADTFINPDITWDEYPEINAQLNKCESVNRAVHVQWEKVENGNERIAGTAE